MPMDAVLVGPLARLGVLAQAIPADAPVLARVLAWGTRDGAAWLHVILQSLGVALLLDRARRDAVLRWPLIGALTVSCGALLAAWLGWPVTDVDPGVFTRLQEGGTAQTIDTLYGHGAHLDRALPGLVGWISVRPADLRPLLWLDAVLALWAICGAAVVSWWHTHNLLRTLLTLYAFSTQIGLLQAATSELSSLLLIAIWWPVLLAWLLWREGRLRAVAVVVWLLATVAAGTSRPESIVFAGSAFAVLALARSTQRWLPRVPRAPPLWVLLVAWLLWMAVVQAFSRGLDNRSRWLLAMLDPLNPAPVWLPGWLAQTAVAGWSALFVAGVYGTWRWRSPVAAVLLGLVLLFKLYAQASHGVHWELLRYTSYLAVPILLVVLQGWRAWDAWWQQRPWKPAAEATLALALMTQLAHGVVDALPASDARVPDVFPPARPPSLLAGNEQAEALYFQAAIDDAPACVLLTRARAPSGRPDEQHSQLVALGRPLSAPVYVDGDRQTARELAREWIRSHRCVRYLRSLDCNVVGFDRCAADVEGASRLQQRQFASIPYSEPSEYGVLQPQLTLAVYALMP